MNSLSVVALWVPRARDPNATHNAVSIALFPPTRTRTEEKKTHKMRTKHRTILIYSEGSSSVKRTSVLASDEINPLSELDLETAVAHEILQSDPRYDPRSVASRIFERFFAENPRISHFDRFSSPFSRVFETSRKRIDVEKLEKSGIVRKRAPIPANRVLEGKIYIESADMRNICYTTPGAL